jgi:hypothetical protein
MIRPLPFVAQSSINKTNRRPALAIFGHFRPLLIEASGAADKRKLTLPDKTE